MMKSGPRPRHSTLPDDSVDRVYPVELIEQDKLFQAIKGLLPGERFVYHRGLLAADAAKDTGAGAAARIARAVAMHAARRRLAALVCKRSGEDFDYIAIRLR